MKNNSRRGFLRASALASLGLTAPAALGPHLLLSKPTDIRIEDLAFSYEEFRYRAPYKFGGVPVDRATILNVNVTVRTRDGRTAKGFGSMPMGNVWSFPSRDMAYDRTLVAMKELADRIGEITSGYKEYGHPIDINAALEQEYLKAAAEISKGPTPTLSSPIPKLCTLVTASPFDAAIHDAFGKVHNRSCYQTYGRDLLPRDLSNYLNADFKGEFLDRYILPKPKPQIAMFHSVGGAELTSRSNYREKI
jgi:hypothetical protein